ncbi:MAG: exodeoxyribonuclease III [Chitinophagaceae bacterium]|nr:exodeoxyribonuclease III [Rubrivivax sp.]
MRLATWNVNSLAVRLPQMLDWLAVQAATAPVDVLVLQETKLTDDKFPRAEIEAAGYEVHWFGQRTYNGVALLSRTPAADIAKNIVDFDDDQARLIAGTVQGIRVIGGYFPNGQAPDSDKFTYKMRWLTGLQNWIRAELARHPQLVLMGDFNIAPEDRDAYDPVLLAGSIHLTPEERAQFRALLDLGLVDAFRLFEQPPKSYSWWDYRMLGFQKNKGLRIDHVLVSQALRSRVTACTIDRLPRKAPRPSDHAPVIVELTNHAPVMPEPG